MLVREYLFVYELFHLIDIGHRTAESIHGRVFPVPYDAEKQVVRSYPVASCPHSLLP